MQTLRLVEAIIENGHHCVTVCYFEYDTKIVQLFEQAGSKVVCLSDNGQRPTSQREVFFSLRKGLKEVVCEYRPKVAMVQYMAPGAMPVIILRMLGIKNIIAMLHTDADIYRNLWLVRFLQRYVTRLFTCVTETAERNFFGSSHIVGASLQVQGYKKNNHCTLPNCLPRGFQFQVSDSKFDSLHLINIHRCSQPSAQNSQFTIHNSQFIIGFVARLEEIKGADLVIPAFAKVIEFQLDIKLLIVGDGKLRKKMSQQQKEFNIPEEKIEWAGMVDYCQLPDYYKCMTLVWVPSRSEGFGLSAIEAMGHGCPVVAADVGGLKEIVHDGKDGLHFEPQNCDDLATKTIQLLSGSQILQSMSNQAISTARQYSFDTYKNRMRTIIALLTTNHYPQNWAE